MEYCFLKGFLVVLLIQHSTAEDLSTSIQSSTAITLQEGQTLPLEQELPPAEVVPVVAPPSLEEVQQAVQEASEQVEGRGAEEVLKGLLERAVEAALVQAEGGGEAKTDEAPEQETVDEELLGGVRKEDAEDDTGAEVLEQEAVEKVEGEGIGANGGETGAEEVQVVAENDAAEDVAQEGDGVLKGQVETTAETVEEEPAGVATEDSDAQAVEITDEILDPQIIQEVMEEGAAEETGGYLVEDAGVEDKKEQVLLLEGTATQEVEEPGLEVTLGGEPEQETVAQPELGLAGQTGTEKEAPAEQTQVDNANGEAHISSSDNNEMETTRPVAGEPGEGEGNDVENTIGPEIEDKHLVEEGANVEVVSEGAEVMEAEQQGESVIIEEPAVNEGVGDQGAGDNEEIALENPHDNETENQEALVISDPEPEDGADVSIEQSPENQTPTLSPSAGEAETEENTPDDQKSNHGNEIITPTDEALPGNPVVARPTLDNFVKVDLAKPPQAEGEKLGEANELVEDAAGSTEMTELGLEAWKIGAISAAVFLVLETVIIIIYILKRRNKNSTLALQRACEEGCVEPEAATGGDCSDDTLPAGNGDTQQITALDPSDVASTLAPNKEQHEEEHVIAMSDLQANSTKESTTSGPGPDSSQDLRTSTL